MTPRYYVRKERRARWAVVDKAYNSAVCYWPNKRLANSWVKEHQEDIGPKFLYRVEHLDVFEGGGMSNSIRASLTVVKTA